MVSDTIFALSSGSTPAAIAVIRISGPAAGEALAQLAGSLPVPRRASYRALRVPRGTLLDRALVIWFPGPETATGEDIAELHVHGGRAVVRAVETALGELPELRRATPGEFTRRAFTNGRIDLAEAEGLADLLAAETELQRRSAMAMAGGALSRIVEAWRERILAASAAVEAALDFSEEDDVAAPVDLDGEIGRLIAELNDWLERPRAETLREGFRVALAGPPNAGKSTLFNVLVESEAAITTPYAGTTRDVLTRSVAIDGVPFVFVDTAGLRDEPGDPIEAIGIARAREAAGSADLVLWLGPEGGGPPGAWEIAPQADRLDVAKVAARHVVSALTGAGLDRLRRDLVDTARSILPGPGEIALNRRQRELLQDARDALAGVRTEGDLLLVAEGFRLARAAFDALVGRATTEDMLDALFGRFCLGK